MAQDPVPAMNLDELLEYREVTERISAFLYKRLKDHVAALAYMLSPGRVLGRHVGARDVAPRADEAYADLTQRYQLACGTPFDLKQDLDEQVMLAVGSTIQVYPYEYFHEAQGKTSRRISMTSPVRWIVTYGSDSSPEQIRDMFQGQGERRAQSVRQFVVNALAFQVVLSRNASASQILKDLRYEISAEPMPGLAKLPLTNVTIQLPSFRPADDLLLTAVRLSGVPAFIELIGMNAVRELRDPLREQIETAAGGQE